MHRKPRNDGSVLAVFIQVGTFFSGEVPMRLVTTKKNLFIVVCLLFFLSGCISTKVTSYEEVERASFPQDYPIKVIDLAHELRPYTVIGYIEIKASELYSTETIFRKMRKRARRLGGNALSDIIQQPVDKKFPFFFDYLNFYGNIWSAEVIAWEDE